MRKIKYKEISPQLDRMAAPDFVNQPRASLGMEKFIGEYYFIDIEKLIPYRNQARRIFNEEEIEQLAETIKEHGIRQPLTILKSELNEGLFEVVSGERRLRAAKLIGLTKVPCIILTDLNKAEEIALVENIQRVDLHPVELARSLSRLLETKGHGSQTDLARKLGITKSKMSETLKILELDDNLLNYILDKNVRGRKDFRKLLELPDNESRVRYIDKIISVKEDDIKEVAKKHNTFTPQSILNITLSKTGLKMKQISIEKLGAEEKNEIKAVLQAFIDSL